MFGHASQFRRDHSPAHRMLVHFGVMACGLAGGVVEFFALQRSRLQQRPPRSKTVWHR